MAEIFLRKTPGGFVPDTERDQDRVRRFKVGEVARAVITKPRNYGNHKRLFALLQFISEYSDVYDNVEKALVAVKLASGHVDWVPNPETGELVPVPKSISYEAMEEVEFSVWFESAVNATLKHITPRMNRIAIDEAIETVALW